MSDTYHVWTVDDLEPGLAGGVVPAYGRDVNLYSPDGEPWCWFAAGPIVCANGDSCRCRGHRITEGPAAGRILMTLLGMAAR